MRLTGAIFFTALVLFAVDSAGQQKRILNGIATDGYRNGVSWINVMVKGTLMGTRTDNCGRFAIPIDTDEVTLVFQAMTYDDTRTYEIRLKRAEVLGDTLVFQLGRGKVPNKDCAKVNRRFRKVVIE